MADDHTSYEALLADMENCETLEEAIELYGHKLGICADTPEGLDALNSFFSRTLPADDDAERGTPVLAAHGDQSKRSFDLGKILEKIGLRGPELPVETVDEEDGTPVVHYKNEKFENWGKTVRNVYPRHTFVPTTRTGVLNIVRFALSRNLRIRCAGSRHSWSSIFGKSGEVLIQFMPVEAALGVILSSFHTFNPQDTELEYIQLVKVENGGESALVKLGAAATSDHFRMWCLSEQHGDWRWMLNALPILTEITSTGWTQPICHGAGIQHPVVSDMVVEIEFVNAKGEIQIVNDPAHLRAAAASFGMVGVILSQTFRLSKLKMANLMPVAVPTPLAIPPLSRDSVPETEDFSVSQYSDEDLEEARNTMIQEFDKFYVEYFWFPFQKDMWVNNWDTRDYVPENDGRPEYPTDSEIKWQFAQSNIAQAFQKTALRLAPGIKQARLFGTASMAVLPNGRLLNASVCDALHFRRAIHQMQVQDFEAEIAIPRNENGELEVEIVQQAWWMAINKVYEEEKKGKAPLRVAIEMRMMGGSTAYLAAQRGNEATCAIEVLTNPITPVEEWRKFVIELNDLWATIKVPSTGQPVKILPHWAKEWPRRIQGRRTKSFLREAYKEGAVLFRENMSLIAEEGGYELEDMWNAFGNDNILEVVHHDRKKHPFSMIAGHTETIQGWLSSSMNQFIGL